MALAFQLRSPPGDRAKYSNLKSIQAQFMSSAGRPTGTSAACRGPPGPALIGSDKLERNAAGERARPTCVPHPLSGPPFEYDLLPGAVAGARRPVRITSAPASRAAGANNWRASQTGAGANKLKLAARMQVIARKTHRVMRLVGQHKQWACPPPICSVSNFELSRPGAH